MWVRLKHINLKHLNKHIDNYYKQVEHNLTFILFRD